MVDGIPEDAEYEFTHAGRKYYLKRGRYEDNCLFTAKYDGLWSELGMTLEKAILRYKATPYDLESIMDRYLEENNVTISV